MESDLTSHRQIWAQNHLLRNLYESWYRKMIHHASPVPGVRLEIGGGIGNLKEYDPSIVTTDVVRYPWIDAQSDAQALPFRDQSVANIFLFDVLHHIPSPMTFVEEATRVLVLGGRMVIMEPYISPFSNIVYSICHPENHDLSTDPFSAASGGPVDPLDGDQAIPTVMFWKRQRDFEIRFPTLCFEHTERLAFLAYPLSGGFRRRALLPSVLLQKLNTWESKVPFLSSAMAFRCLTVLSKNTSVMGPDLKQSPPDLQLSI